ncbi:hypothetical protein GCM10010168_93260 [Actinoplanes ianthinogenes]|nr:hypothetical protein GCM10010168_93260 [Actinoplanes ianthinogenes]
MQRLVTSEVGQITDPQRLGQGEGELQLRHLQPAGLHCLDPRSGSPDEAAELIAGEAAARTQELKTLTEGQRIAVRIHRCSLVEDRAAADLYSGHQIPRYVNRINLQDDLVESQPIIRRPTPIIRNRFTPPLALRHQPEAADPHRGMTDLSGRAVTSSAPIPVLNGVSYGKADHPIADDQIGDEQQEEREGGGVHNCQPGVPDD